jgi:hypothetical protein
MIYREKKKATPPYPADANLGGLTKSKACTTKYKPKDELNHHPPLPQGQAH